MHAPPIAISIPGTFSNEKWIKPPSHVYYTCTYCNTRVHSVLESTLQYGVGIHSMPWSYCNIVQSRVSYFHTPLVQYCNNMLPAYRYGHMEYTQCNTAIVLYAFTCMCIAIHVYRYVHVDR